MSRLRSVSWPLIAAATACANAAAWAKSPPISSKPQAAAAVQTKPYAQGLVDRMLYLNPQILRLDLITTPAGKSGPQIVASSVPSDVGRPAPQPGAGDCRAMEHLREYRCSLEMRDTPRNAIGTVLISLRFYPGQDTQQLTGFATAVRDQLAETTPDIPALFDAMTIAPKAGDLQSQCAILDVISRHPDLMVLAMHVTPPGQTVNKMLAINEPRFWGKTSEEIEQKLATNGNILVETYSKTHRLETHVPILAADDKQVGSLATVYLYHAESEVPGLLQKTLEVQQELKPMIRDLNWLYEPCQLTSSGAPR